MRYYPDNSASHYFTKLPQDINLTGNYEVGLSEIQFSNTYLNVRENDCYFHFVAPEVEADKNKPEYKGPLTAEGIVPAGLYESNEFFFIHTLDSLIKIELGNRKNGKARVKFYYNTQLWQRSEASLTVYEQGALLRLSSSLQRILSVRSHTLIGPRHYAGDFYHGLECRFQECLHLLRSRQRPSSG